MPRVTRIDRSDAFKAIENVISRGEAPTHINVRAELGQRGSPPVISNFIGSWFACYGASLIDKAAAAPALPSAAGQPAADGGAIAALTAAALQEISRASAARDEAHARAAAEALAALEAEKQALLTRDHELQLKEQACQEHIQRAYTDRDRALQERDLALGDAASLRQALGESKAQLASVKEHLAQLQDLGERISGLELRLA